jgi:hypothetical protein
MRSLRVCVAREVPPVSTWRAKVLATAVVSFFLRAEESLKQYIRPA